MITYLDKHIHVLVLLLLSQLRERDLVSQLNNQSVDYKPHRAELAWQYKVNKSQEKKHAALLHNRDDTAS